MALSQFGFRYVYALLVSLAMFLMVLDGLRVSRTKKYYFIYTYLLFLLTVAVVQSFIYGEHAQIIKAFFLYTTMLLYWMLYFNKYSINEFKYLLIKTLPIVYCVALLGVIQYFFSPSLFGLLTNVSKGIDWAESTSFSEYIRFFRASSILGSPQVYGLFIALYIVILLNVYSVKGFWLKAGFFLLLFSGILSGNKSFFFIVSAYLIFVFVKAGFLQKVLVSGFLILVIASSLLIFPNFSFDEIRAVGRVTSIDTIVEEEGQDSRLSRYSDIILNANPLIGNLLGSKTNREQVDIEVAESYIFQIISEAGWLVLLSFSFMLLFAVILAHKELMRDIRPLLLLIYFSMLIVHAFNSPLFFIFWGIIVSSFVNDKNRVNKANPDYV